MMNGKNNEGYATAIIGKWGLGAPHSESIPNKHGFDYFFGYNCQRLAHTYYPLFLREDDKRVNLKNDTIALYSSRPAPGTRKMGSLCSFDLWG